MMSAHMNQPAKQAEQATQSKHLAEHEARQVQRDAERALVKRRAYELLQLFDDATCELDQPIVALAIWDEIRSALEASDLPDTMKEAVRQELQGRDKLIRSAASHSSAVLQELERSVTSMSVWKRFSNRLHGVHPAVADACISCHPPSDISPLTKDRMKAVNKILREQWVNDPELDSRSVFTVHRDEQSGKSIIQFGNARCGVFYISVPALLSPEALAERTIHLLTRRMGVFVKDSDPIAIINGAHQGVCYNNLFKLAQVFRCRKIDQARFRTSLQALYHEAPISPQNTWVVSGLPEEFEGYRSLFPGSLEDWDKWEGLAQEWHEVATMAGHAPMASANRDVVLHALQTEKNVMILVAHADGQRIYMPSPPPAGSSVSIDDIHLYREQISANNPLVYLFCCEVAKISDLANFAEALVECGATVIAPQTGVDLHKSLKLFEGVIEPRSPAPPIESFRISRNDSGYHEMEIYIA